PRRRRRDGRGAGALGGARADARRRVPHAHRPRHPHPRPARHRLDRTRRGRAGRPRGDRSMTAPSLAAPSGTTPRLPAPTPRPGRHVRAGAGAMVARSLRLVRREPDELVLGLVLPVMLMILFVYVFGGAMSVGTDYVTYATPGIVMLCEGYGEFHTDRESAVWAQG